MGDRVDTQSAEGRRCMRRVDLLGHHSADKPHPWDVMNSKTKAELGNKQMEQNTRGMMGMWDHERGRRSPYANGSGTVYILGV